MKVVCNIDAGKILRRRGLQPGGPVQRWFTNECAKLMDGYVPMQSGTKANRSAPTKKARPMRSRRMANVRCQKH